MTSRLFRLFACIALPALLSACWMAQTALVGPANASRVEFGGPYKPETEDVSVRAVAEKDGSYTLTDGKDGFNAHYLALGEGWYLVELDFKPIARSMQVQSKDNDGSMTITVPDGDGPWLYNLMRMTGGDLAFYRVSCDDRLAAMPGVTVEAGGGDIGDGCVIANLSALRAVARDTIARIEAGEAIADLRWLRAIE